MADSTSLLSQLPCPCGESCSAKASFHVLTDINVFRRGLSLEKNVYIMLCLFCIVREDSGVVLAIAQDRRRDECVMTANFMFIQLWWCHHKEHSSDVFLLQPHDDQQHPEHGILDLLPEAQRWLVCSRAPTQAFCTGTELPPPSGKKSYRAVC